MPKAKELIQLLELLDVQSDEFSRVLTNEPKEKRVYNEKYLTGITELHKKFFEFHEFRRGQLVKWKKGLKNKKLPYEDQPAIVVDVIKEPIYGEYDPGTPYFREPLDLILGIIGDDDEYLIFHFDKRRFEPFEQEK